MAKAWLVSSGNYSEAMHSEVTTVRYDVKQLIKYGLHAFAAGHGFSALLVALFMREWLMASLCLVLVGVNLWACFGFVKEVRQ